MTDPSTPSLNGLLAQLCRRQRILHTLDFALRGALAGLAAAAAVAIIGALTGSAWMHAGAWRVLICLPLGVLFGAIAGALRPVNRLAVARAIDFAGRGEDRFASALQLADHHRRARAGLIEQDALRAVGAVSIQSALPWRTPRILRFSPLPVVALGLAFWLAPQPPAAARPAAPEIEPDEWAAIHDDFKKDLRDVPDPRNPRDRELSDKLEKLAKMLKENPQKKEVLEQIARLKSELEKRRQSLANRNLSARRAASAMKSSSALKPFAQKMREGQYRKSADELKQLAEKIRKNAQAMSAEDFESAASDLDRLSSELESNRDLSSACKNAASAAGSMDRDKFADSLDEFARKMESNCDDMEECDSLCKSCNALDELQRRLNHCKSCSDCKDGTCNKPGCRTCNSFVRHNNKKGGLKAGWGTADKWDGGTLNPRKEQRTPTMAAAREHSGKSMNFKVVSKDERAESSMDYKDVYADFVQKAEADLSLESAPLAYRDFLRKYFTAIKPQDEAAPAAPEK